LVIADSNQLQRFNNMESIMAVLGFVKKVAAVAEQ